MNDLNALRTKLEGLAVNYEGRMFTPQLVDELRQELDQILQSIKGNIYYVNGKHQTVNDFEIMTSGGKIKLLVTWNPNLYHQNYKEVKNFIHNTVGLNEQTFQQLVQMEIAKLFKAMEEDGSLSELLQNEIKKYLGSYKAGLPGTGYNHQYRLRELVTQHIAEQVANSFDVNVMIKGNKDNA